MGTRAADRHADELPVTAARMQRLRHLLGGAVDPIGPHPAVAAAQRPAAVLFPLTWDGDALHAVLTVRNANLKSHPGQISFPGGRVEPRDADVADTALRETFEEIGVVPGDVTVIGSLPPYLTGTGYCVVPVLGCVPSGYAYRPDPREVAEVFHVPFEHLLDPSNHARKVREFNGRSHQYYEIDYRGRVIWGATAGMIVALHGRLTAYSAARACGDVFSQLRDFAK